MRGFRRLSKGKGKKIMHQGHNRSIVPLSRAQILMTHCNIPIGTGRRNGLRSKVILLGP